MQTNEPIPIDKPWPEGHAEFAAYCDAHPEALTDLTPFGWFQAGLRAGWAEVQTAIEGALAKTKRGAGRPPPPR